MANLITCSRIVLSLIMLLFSVCSPSFYCCYLCAGFTDMIDGTVARARGTAGACGARLDTVADFVFVFAAAYKLLPVLNLSFRIWIWTGIIACIKGINMISGLAIQKRFVAVHTMANKLTGLLLFLLPLSTTIMDFRYNAVAVCIVATFAAIQEGHFIRTRSKKEA